MVCYVDVHALEPRDPRSTARSVTSGGGGSGSALKIYISRPC